MDKLISSITRLFRHASQLKSMSSQLKSGDNPELTNYLKSNPEFIKMSKRIFDLQQEAFKKLNKYD